jgi:hypothetical protein
MFPGSTVVVDHFLVGVSYQGLYLQTLIPVGCRRSGTTRRGVLGRSLVGAHSSQSMPPKPHRNPDVLESAVAEHRCHLPDV